MRRLILASAALLLAYAAMPSAPAEASWRIVRWPNGDCKIWNDYGVGVQPVTPPPFTLLTPRPLPSWEASWVVLGKLQAKRLCTI